MLGISNRKSIVKATSSVPSGDADLLWPPSPSKTPAWLKILGILARSSPL
jgi:hypothetical protein